MNRNLKTTEVPTVQFLPFGHSAHEAFLGRSDGGSRGKLD